MDLSNFKLLLFYISFRSQTQLFRITLPNEVAKTEKFRCIRFASVLKCCVGECVLFSLVEWVVYARVCFFHVVRLFYLIRPELVQLWSFFFRPPLLDQVAYEWIFVWKIEWHNHRHLHRWWPREMINQVLYDQVTIGTISLHYISRINSHHCRASAQYLKWKNERMREREMRKEREVHIKLSNRIISTPINFSATKGRHRYRHSFIAIDAIFPRTRTGTDQMLQIYIYIIFFRQNSEWAQWITTNN